MKQTQPLKFDIACYRALIFDMDGVLTDTSHAHFLAWKGLAKQLGYDLPPCVEDEVRGISRLDSLDVVLKYSPRPIMLSKEERDHLATKKNEDYLSIIRAYDASHLSEGVLEFLDWLRGNSGHLKIGLASASANAPFLLKAMGIDSYFDYVVNPLSVERGKPAPDLFLAAAAGLGIKPHYCIGIEDALAGIEAINAAGMLALGIEAHQGPGRLNQAYASFKNMKDLHHFMMGKD